MYIIICISHALRYNKIRRHFITLSYNIAIYTLKRSRRRKLNHRCAIIIQSSASAGLIHKMKYYLQTRNYDLIDLVYTVALQTYFGNIGWYNTGWLKKNNTGMRWFLMGLPQILDIYVTTNNNIDSLMKSMQILFQQSVDNLQSIVVFISFNWEYNHYFYFLCFFFHM